MKLLIKTFYFIFVTFLVASCQKYDDESRPYEFGFTIDGQQHRHEKKDVNGIIQGEFGFITADGIYHVTVYATDENGNFKILSMKNIRISAPLDGSPLPEGQRISDNPNVNQGQINLSPQTSPVSQRSPVYQNSPIVKPLVQNLPRPLQNIPRPLQNLPPPTPTKTSRGPYAFTTQPTIKPACGGCGYITTSKPKPGQQAFPFQTPAFQSLPENKPRNSGGQIQSERYSAISNPLSAYPNPEISNTGSELKYPVQPILQQNLFNEPIKSLGKTDANPGPELFNNPIKNTGKVETIPGSEPSYPAGTKPGAIQPSYPRPNEINSPKRQSPLSRVSVSNGAIHVPGNPDIPIRDKYPGMVDGLPKGITEKDITDLLYKFNYTIGFHGHYEKGLKNGAKIGGYFVNGRDGISRIVTYVADENGFRPKVKFVRLDLNSDDVPKEGTEKRFGLKNFEFVWYPVS